MKIVVPRSFRNDVFPADAENPLIPGLPRSAKSRKDPAEMHLPCPSFLSKEWGEVQATNTKKKYFNGVWMAAIVVVLFGVITLITRNGELSASQDNRIRFWTSVGIAHLVQITGKINLFYLITIAFLFIVFVGGVYQVNRKWTAMVISFFFIISNVFVYNKIQNTFIIPRKKQNVIIRTIRDNPTVFPKGSCINYDQNSLIENAWHHWNIGFNLYDREIRRVDLLANKEALCGNALISSRNDIDKIISGACLIVQEEHESLYLWIFGDDAKLLSAKLKRSY